jgi:ubiquinol-cytochrome c reductase iron-sulfur subunit
MTQGHRIAVVALAIAIVGSIGFIASYAIGGSRLYEGVALACATAGFAAAALAWAFGILPHEEMVDLRDDYPSSPAELRAESSEVARSEADLSRGRALFGLLGAAIAVFAAALIVPFRSLGPAIDATLFHTKWRKGVRLVREDGTPIRADAFDVDAVVTVFPQTAVGDALSQTVLIRLPDDVSGTAQGYIAYSKVCTHAGCPVALYRRTARELMCPCHQSVFNVVGNGAVVSGPADHALPRLPIAVGSDGYLIATGDYPVAVGPGFWERA